MAASSSVPKVTSEVDSAACSPSRPTGTPVPLTGRSPVRLNAASSKGRPRPAFPRLAFTAVFALAAFAARAQDLQPPIAADSTLLQVSAHAEAHRVPDVAMMSAGVVTQ